MSHSILFYVLTVHNKCNSYPKNKRIMGLYAHARLRLAFVQGVETLRERV